MPPVAHPIVRTHPETGRKAIFLGDHAESIEGMDYDEGRALIEELNVLDHAAGERLFAHLGAARNAWCGTTAARCIAPPASTRRASSA